MEAYKSLQKAFQKLGKSTVEWHKTARFPKSMETANSILYRDAVVDASTLAYMAFCLDMANKQTIAILEQYAKEIPKKAPEVAVLIKLIAPVDITSEEQDLVARLRKMDSSKRDLVTDLVEKLS